MPNHSRILDNIANCTDPAKLRRYMKNARQRGADEIYDAAFHRLIHVQPEAETGTVAYDVWRRSENGRRSRPQADTIRRFARNILPMSVLPSTGTHGRINSE